jgi:hypothetical protein
MAHRLPILVTDRSLTMCYVLKDAQSAMHCLTVVQIPVAAINTTAPTRQPPPTKNPIIQKQCRLARPATHKRPEPSIKQDNAMAKHNIKCTETRRFSLLAATHPLLFLLRLCLPRSVNRASIAKITIR